MKLIPSFQSEVVLVPSIVNLHYLILFFFLLHFLTKLSKIASSDSLLLKSRSSSSSEDLNAKFLLFYFYFLLVLLIPLLSLPHLLLSLLVCFHYFTFFPFCFFFLFPLINISSCCNNFSSRSYSFTLFYLITYVSGSNSSNKTPLLLGPLLFNIFHIWWPGSWVV